VVHVVAPDPEPEGSPTGKWAIAAKGVRTKEGQGDGARGARVEVATSAVVFRGDPAACRVPACVDRAVR
jgi:hypothetical protein